MDIRAYEDDFFYDALGYSHWLSYHFSMRVSERRHQVVDEIIENHTPKPTRILDIGCNKGKFLARIARSYDYILLAGLDADDEALMQAKEVIFCNYKFGLKDLTKRPLLIGA